MSALPPPVVESHAGIRVVRDDLLPGGTFEDDASELPPFPSAKNYDAKAWFYIKRRATSGALFWNVGA